MEKDHISPMKCQPIQVRVIFRLFQGRQLGHLTTQGRRLSNRLSLFHRLCFISQESLWTTTWSKVQFSSQKLCIICVKWIPQISSKCSIRGWALTKSWWTKTNYLSVWKSKVFIKELKHNSRIRTMEDFFPSHRTMRLLEVQFKEQIALQIHS